MIWASMWHSHSCRHVKLKIKKDSDATSKWFGPQCGAHIAAAMVAAAAELKEEASSVHP